jgi:hypothetical protein
VSRPNSEESTFQISVQSITATMRYSMICILKKKYDHCCDKFNEYNQHRKHKGATQKDSLKFKKESLTVCRHGWEIKVYFEEI